MHHRTVHERARRGWWSGQDSEGREPPTGIWTGKWEVGIALGIGQRPGGVGEHDAVSETTRESMTGTGVLRKPSTRHRLVGEGAGSGDGPALLRGTPDPVQLASCMVSPGDMG